MIAMLSSILASISSVLAALAPVIAVFFYVGPAYALYKMAKDLGIKGAWLAWVPYANVYTLGAIADHQMKHNDGKDFKLRNILLGAQIGVVGIPVVFRFTKFFLTALADLLLLPASFCVSILSVIITNLGAFTDAGLEWETLWGLIQNYLWIFLLVIAVFTALNWLTKFVLNTIYNVLSLAATVVGWVVIIGKYVSFYKVYELYAPKFAMPMLAGTLALELLAGVSVISSFTTPLYRIAFPTLLLILAHRKPVYKNASQPVEAKPETVEAPVEIPVEFPVADPVPAMG